MQNDNLKVRLRNWLDRDIKQGLQTLEERSPNNKLAQGEMSDLIRSGVRRELKERGVIPNDNGYFENPKSCQQIN